jgi:hypothetical protein
MINSAPFGLGQTYYGESGTIDVSSSYANVDRKDLEGLEGVFNDIDSATNVAGGVVVQRTADVIKARLVRNASGVTLYGGFVVTYAAASKLKRVNGYARTDAASVAGVVSPFLGSGGVRDGDLFWVIEEGYCLLRVPKTGAAFPTDIAAGDALVALTDAAANATTTSATNIAGRIAKFPTFNVTSNVTDGTIANYAMNRFATAISAATTHQTTNGHSILAYVKVPRN